MSELIPNTIRCFAVPIPPGPGVHQHDVMAFACDEEGMTLSSHYCSNVDWAKADILSQCHHNHYIVRYPEGYVCEWVDNIPEDWKRPPMFTASTEVGITVSQPVNFDASKIIITQEFVDRVLARAAASQFGLDFDEEESRKPTDIDLYAQKNLQSLAMLLVGKCHAKYNLISVFHAALEELTESLVNMETH